MYLGINTLKSRWFKFAFVATVIWDVLFMSFFWILFWAYDSFIGYGIFFLSNLLVIGTITLVGISTLINPPILRPWYIKFGVWLSFLAGINAGIVAFLWNDGQLPYLPLYTIFTTVGLLSLNGYLLHYAYTHPPKQNAELPSDETPSVILVNIAPKPTTAPVPKGKLAIAIALTLITQVAVVGWTFWSIGKPQYRNYRDFHAFSNECQEQDKYPFMHTYQKEREIITNDNLLRPSSSVKRGDSTFHCYSTLDEALKDYPNFNEILYEVHWKYIPPSEAEIAHDKLKLDAEKIINSGPIGKKHLNIMWIDDLPDEIKMDRVIFRYSDNANTNVLPWKAEYSSQKVDGVIGYWCGEFDNPLLKPEDFDSTKWQATMNQLNGKLPEPAQRSTTFFATEDRKLWVITYGTIAPSQEDFISTRCILYDNHQLLSKEDGDAMIDGITSRVQHYPIDPEDGMIIIERE